MASRFLHKLITILINTSTNNESLSLGCYVVPWLQKMHPFFIHQAATTAFFFALVCRMFVMCVYPFRYVLYSKSIDRMRNLNKSLFSSLKNNC